VAELLNELGKGISEVLIFTPAEAIPRHFDPAAEELRFHVQRAQVFALAWVEYCSEAPITSIPQAVQCLVPGELISHPLSSIADWRMEFYPLLAPIFRWLARLRQCYFCLK